MNASESSVRAEDASEPPGAAQSVSADTEAAPVESSGLQSLGELLLQGEPTESTSLSGDTTEQAPGESPDDKAPLTNFNDLAERLGVEVAELYGLELAHHETGEKFTVGDMKDAFASHQQHQLDQIEWEERRATEQRELLKEATELKEIMAALPPGSINESTLTKIRDRAAANLELQNTETLRVIPEWADPTQREADLTGMSKQLQEYGLPVNFLEGVTDHRLRKYMRDMWQLQERVTKAMSMVRKDPPKTPQSRSTGSRKSGGQPLTKETGGLKALKTVQ